MKKEHILNEVRRTAINGEPLGQDRFKTETGIMKSEWHGKYWTNWGEALKEAGYEPNKFTEAFGEEWLIEQLASFIHNMGRVPTEGEFKLKKNNDKSFPSFKTFLKRFGREHERANKVIEYCEKNNVYPDVIEICRPISKKSDTKKAKELDDDIDTEGKSGHVYMLEHDGVYKIGSSTDATQRYKQIKVQMPFETKEIHVISTDDPSGIEAYWHNRFKDKKNKRGRKMQGEWFNLSASDIKAFKKRKFM